MPNNNYARGAAFENKVKSALEAEGFVAVRAAGSHGLTDIIAVGGFTILFIQCKTGKAKMSKKDKLTLYSQANEHYASAMVCSPGAESDIRWEVIQEDGSLKVLPGFPLPDHN